MTVVNVREAKTQLSRLIEQALRGEEVVIARNGVPAVKLVQVDQDAAVKPWREPGQLAGVFVEIDPDWWKPDDELADLFEGSDSFENRERIKRTGSPMKLLLDSRVLLWWSGLQSGRLPATIVQAIGQAERLSVSVATIWELEIKRNAGKIAFSADAWATVEALGVSWLTIERDDTVAAGRLPLLHRDPFDRMLVAQAMQRGLTLATADRTLAEYGVAILAV